MIIISMTIIVILSRVFEALWHAGLAKELALTPCTFEGKAPCTHHPEVYMASEDKKIADKEVVVENVPDIIMVKEKTSVVPKLVAKNMTAKEKADAKRKAATEAKEAATKAKEAKKVALEVRKAAAAAKKEAAKNAPKPAPCKAYVNIKERFQKEFFARLGVR